MTPKEKVLRMYPDAYVAEDVDGFWWVWTPKIRGALNGAAHETRSPGIAWLEASKRLPPNNQGNRHKRA